MRQLIVFAGKHRWPQWRTHWNVLHAWPPGAQALALGFLTLCLTVAGSWHVSSLAWQTWWEQDEQHAQSQQETDTLSLQVAQQRKLIARLTALPHPSGIRAAAWQSWPEELTQDDKQMLKQWMQWGQAHGLNVYAAYVLADHSEGIWRGTLPQLLAAWHGLQQALPRMRMTGFDLRTAAEDASVATLVLHMQWVNEKNNALASPDALKINTLTPNFIKGSSVTSEPRDTSRVDAPLMSKTAFIHNPFSINGLKAGLPLGVTTSMGKGWAQLQHRPLSHMRWAGSLVAADKRQALLTLEGLIYSVSLGDRLGQDWGEVTRIHTDHLWLREWFADASGTWLSREKRFPTGESP